MSAPPVRTVLALLAGLTMASCGGGGSNDAPGALAASSSVQGQCAAPRLNTADRPGSLSTEKSWVHAWIDESYLWYTDVRELGATTLDAKNYGTPIDYFDALKSAKTTASGSARDKFHFTYDTAAWKALSQSGQSIGYGFDFTLSSPTPPRTVTVTTVEPNSAAALQGVVRGEQLTFVNGVDVVNATSQMDVDILNAGMFPTVEGYHTLTFQNPRSGATHTQTLYAMAVTSTPVQNVHALPAPHAQVGYMLFNDHIATAEGLLIAAIRQLKTLGVNDLVLDLRYNGGGYLDIASELAYMIAGPRFTAGKTFEQQNYNDKNPFGLTLAERTMPFHDRSQGFGNTAAGQALPTLGLGHISVLVGVGTCSASEAIINGLRGAGVVVDVVGSPTCGKPYGFYPADNCGTTYFAIQFQGVNQQGFGDYADGFTPTCAAADDFTHALGDPAEGRLAVALAYRDTGRCTPGVSRAQRMQAQAARGEAADAEEPAPPRPPWRENRLYRAH